MQLTCQIIVAVWQLFTLYKVAIDARERNPHWADPFLVVGIMSLQIGVLYLAGTFSLLVK